MKIAKKLLVLSLSLAATYSMNSFAIDATTTKDATPTIISPAAQLDTTPPAPEGGLSPDKTLPITMPKTAAVSNTAATPAPGVTPNK